MKSPEGQEVMLNTDFETLFDKMMQILAVCLSKPVMIFEDKSLVENALSILVGILLYRKNIYSRFISFSAQGKISSAEQLCLAGLLCHEEKVRADFAQSLGVLALNLSQEQNALYFLLGLLARNFADISNKPSRQFFELFNRLIDLKARRDSLLGDFAEDSSAIYNPEELLNLIIDKIKQQ